MINLEDTTMTKKVYNLPAVEVTHIALESIVLAGSPAPTGDMEIHAGIETNDQW